MKKTLLLDLKRLNPLKYIMLKLQLNLQTFFYNNQDKKIQRILILNTINTLNCWNIANIKSELRAKKYSK
jgi:hypothetical protein